MAIIKSKYEGTCNRCRRTYQPGEQVDWARGRGATCAIPCAYVAPPEPTGDLKRVVEHLQALSKAGDLNDFTGSLLAQYAAKGSLSERQVAVVLKRLDENKAQAGRCNGQAITEPGVYEKDDVIYVVKPTKDGKRLYAKEIVEINADRLNVDDEVVQIEFVYVKGAINRLCPTDKMDLERAKALTIRYGRCIVCGRTLKAAESVERGIGPVCVKSFRVREAVAA